MNTEEQIKKVTNELCEFLIKKNQDYASASFDLGLVGNCVHIWDKSKRYKNIVIDKQNPNFEKVEDTLRDLAGYAILGLIIFENEKNNLEKNQSNKKKGVLLTADEILENLKKKGKKR